jgi:predicted  nucleic acid-binding Zn-ribbon protein
MTQTSDRYVRLCRAYVKLSDKFQKLDVEHMTLKSKVVPLLKALKAYKQLTQKLQQENHDLQTEISSLEKKYEALKALEALVTPEMEAELAEAEEQMEIVEETIQEMEADSSPDLTPEDKELLSQYECAPEEFTAPGVGASNGMGMPALQEQEGMPAATL